LFPFTYRHTVEMFAITRDVALGVPEDFSRYETARARAEQYRRNFHLASVPGSPWEGWTVRNIRAGEPHPPIVPPGYPRWEVARFDSLSTPPPMDYLRVHGGRWEPERFTIYTQDVIERFAEEAHDCAEWVQRTFREIPEQWKRHLSIPSARIS
jgi:hypothetical protein